MREQVERASRPNGVVRLDAEVEPQVAGVLADPDLFQTVGARYVLEERLGGDERSAVYRAFDRQGQRPVAVRLLPATRDAQTRARFHRLGAALLDLRHPGLVATLDYGIEHDRPYLVSEYLAGGSLRRELETHGPLPAGRVRSILGQLAAALDAAHGAGLLHLDVRPERVLLTGGGLVKLAGLGLAKLQGPRPAERVEPRRAPYLAPELILGDPPGPPTDLYALAALGFELLTGQPPYPATDQPSALARRLVREPPPASALRPDVPLDLDNLLQRTLSPNVRERPQTAAEFGAVLVGDGLAALPDAAWTAGAGVRRGDPGAGVALGRAALVLLPLLATVALLLGAYHAYTNVLPRLFGAGQMVAVPDLRGRSLEEARALASLNGFELLIEAATPTQDLPKGLVAGQQPQPGRSFPRGGTIRLTLSAGIPAPELVGKSVNEARRELIRNGWAAPKVEGRYLPGTPRGAVVEQRPPPGELAADRGAMTLVVAAQNLAAGQAAWSSSNQPAVGAVVDEDVGTAWRAAGPGRQWVEVGLGVPRAIGGIELLPEGPGGPAVHEVWVWDAAGGSQPVHTFRVAGATRDPLFHHFERSLEGVVKVRIVTVESVGPVGWREVRVLDQ